MTSTSAGQMAWEISCPYVAESVSPSLTMPTEKAALLVYLYWVNFNNCAERKFIYYYSKRMTIFAKIDM